MVIDIGSGGPEGPGPTAQLLAAQLPAGLPAGLRAGELVTAAPPGAVGRGRGSRS